MHFALFNHMDLDHTTRCGGRWSEADTPLSIEEIKEIFERINSTKYALNAMEIHNARYGGAFKQFAEEIAAEEFFERHNVFHTNEIRRMQDVRFALVITVTFMSTYFHRDGDIEEFLERFNEDFPDAERLRREIRTVFEFIDELHLDDIRRVWNKADLLSLLVEVHRTLVKEGRDLDPARVSDRLHEFYSEADLAREGQVVRQDATEYQNATIQASNDRKSRQTRGRILYSVITGGKEWEDQPLSV